MGSEQSLYLRQKRGETLVELSAESYERILDSPRTDVIGHRNAKPVVKMT